MGRVTKAMLEHEVEMLQIVVDTLNQDIRNLTIERNHWFIESERRRLRDKSDQGAYSDEFAELDELDEFEEVEKQVASVSNKLRRIRTRHDILNADSRPHWSL